MNLDATGAEFRKLLLDSLVPFWRTYGVDTKYGGILSCMREDGERVSTDKYIWSQARWVWVCAALYNRIEARPEFLEWATAGVHFLLEHGRDSQGRWIFRTTREGAPLEGAISIYSDCFAVYALSEYARATCDEMALQVATETFWQAVNRTEVDGFSETAPYELPAGMRNHGVPMMLTEVANELAQTTGDLRVEAAADFYMDRVMQHFVQPDGVIVEFLNSDLTPAPSPHGTFIMPGHAIECMWFVLHLARRRADAATIARALIVIRRHLEMGWDKEFGGFFLGIDREGGVPLLPNSESKIWWPHTEALYALMLGFKLTGETWCLDWYHRVHDWSFSHFSMPCGEWRQRLDRQGLPIETLIALPVKDPFHLPRTAILMTQLLDPNPSFHPLLEYPLRCR